MRKRTLQINWLWPGLLIGLALLWLAQTYNLLPVAIGDWLGRAWPIVLIALGLYALIGGRLRYASLLIVGLCAILLTGVIVTAYGKQSDQFRQDYHADFSQDVAADTQSIKINISTLNTPIEIAPVNGRTLTASFVGSSQSLLTTDYHVAQGVGIVSLTESRPGSIPLLTAIGHGKLTIQLPTDVPIDTLTLNGASGNLILDATGVVLRSVNVALQNGDITFTLPDLAPQEALGGTVRTSSGNLTLLVPSGLTVKLAIDSGRPAFDPANYLLLSGGVLQTAGTRDFQVALTAGASGIVTLKVP